MMMSHSNPCCRRCGRPVYREDSVWCIHVWKHEGALRHDVVKTEDTSGDDVVLHVRADRECRYVISGYIGKLCDELMILGEIPKSFLEEIRS